MQIWEDAGGKTQDNVVEGFKRKKRDIRVEEVGKRFDDGCDHTEARSDSGIKREIGGIEIDEDCVFKLSISCSKVEVLRLKNVCFPGKR